jgi:hypothetical protein
MGNLSCAKRSGNRRKYAMQINLRHFLFSFLIFIGHGRTQTA